MMLVQSLLLGFMSNKEKTKLKSRVYVTLGSHFFLNLFIWLHQVLVVAYGTFSCGMRTLSCSMWGLPRPVIKYTSSVLAGGFFTTEPPGKPPWF